MTLLWSTIPIPDWEQDDLSELAQENELSGINPEVLAVMDQAESSGDPGAPNSSGYGGFFGLGAGKQYPAGSIPGSQMGTDTSGEFVEEAEVAASAFASYWTGNVLTTENVYQTGSPNAGGAAGTLGEGATYMNEELPTSITGSTTAPTPSTSSSSTPATATTTGLGSDIVGSLLGVDWGTLEGFLVKAMLVLAGIGLFIVAGYKATTPLRKDAEQAAGPLAMAAA
jgi:hypothetical protein